ncbi:hypothetical protein X560_1690 [Listeria fleischmannii 1991]|jgi:hypothetical protein|uniref:Uncharacterized protein n=3 Tax=Listeria fleischmannii TaxID=1069827 RepID=A0A2X3JCX2_9LIST|nr:hypothetical protein [Listeria fleischmannii]EIA20608.1 hypothetical protein KKC_06007 [Listeria fleischmannii subsp. coloradonensis]KMT59149.1 hypothetical protein X560_1690 [Listeria fleischmannii 1991]MBC1398698.1 hypothetical protein [Listeria fleischmannii]MBC1418185.1 hypothetical protein [Listeria fleischmannii]MBC1426958.1 hypothetical protein [Listeria fleischmannii]
MADLKTNQVRATKKVPKMSDALPKENSHHQFAEKTHVKSKPATEQKQQFHRRILD